MSVYHDLMSANATYAASFRHGDREGTPARALAVLTCMDARIDPLAILGLRIGDAKVLRNSGGRATPDALRSLAVAVHALGVRSVAVMHHTNCGMATRDDAGFRQLVLERTGVDPGDQPFYSLGDPERALADDVATVQACPWLGDIEVAGFRYDVTTGRVSRQV